MVLCIVKNIENGSSSGGLLMVFEWWMLFLMLWFWNSCMLNLGGVLFIVGILYVDGVCVISLLFWFYYSFLVVS